jgi:DNA polymerase III subunit beta
MKIVCSKADLSRIISLAQSAASTKNVMPVLTNLLFEADKDSLTVTGTDLELGVRVKINLEVAQAGTATLPAKKLAELVKTFDEGDVEITVKDGVKAEIKSGRATIKLTGVPAEDYPSFPAYRKEKSLSLSSKVFLDMIRRAAFSVSMDETRYILQGALLQSDGKKATMVTTDGHRLSYIEHELSSPQEPVSAVVPSKALLELSRVLEPKDTPVTVYFTENQVFFEMGELTVFSRLLDGQFPNFEQVIPKKNEHTLLANVAPLISVLNRMSPLASDKGNSVKFHLNEDGLQVTASTADVGEGSESLDVEYNGPAMTLAFNARYLLDALKALGSERLDMKLNTPLSPTLITPVGSSTVCRYVVMPMRA